MTDAHKRAYRHPKYKTEMILAHTTGLALVLLMLIGSPPPFTGYGSSLSRLIPHQPVTDRHRTRGPHAEATGDLGLRRPMALLQQFG